MVPGSIPGHSNTLTKQVAREQGADVLVLDALELSRGRFGVLGRGAEVIDKLYTVVQNVHKGEDPEEEDEDNTPAVVPLNEDVLRFFDTLLATSLPGRNVEPNRRIVYMRNFQVISRIAKPLMTHLLHSLYTISKPDTYPPVPYPAPTSKRSNVLLFGTSDTSSLAINANPSDVEKDSLFLSALFSHARSSIPGKSWRHFCCTSCNPGYSEYEDDWTPGKVNLYPVPFNADVGKRVDELAVGALKTLVFAVNVKAKAEEEGWQKEAKAEQIKLMNKTLLSACLEHAGHRSDTGQDIEDVSAWDDIPSQGLLPVQAAKSIVYPALGVMATEPPAGEPPRNFRVCLEESCKAYEKRNKEREDWAKGVVSDSTQSEGEGDEETEPKPSKGEGDEETDEESKPSKEDIENLIKGVSYYARELKGCIVDTGSIETTFSSVFVDPAIIESLQTIVSLPLLYPSYFKSGVLATEAIGGILLYGPPGTGKTMLCRALAKTSKARMIHIKPSDINDMYLGESEKKVAAVFELAYKLAPCIVFVDEIDALFSSRNGSTKSWERNILTEFMQGMDGLGSAKKNRDSNIVVVGATNRPFDLDLAILRRMPRRILVDMPNAQMRKEILGSYLKNEEIEEEVSVERLARETEGFSGSDLKNLCVAAALASVKEAIGSRWSDSPSPPTPPKTPTSDTSDKEKDGEKSPQGVEDEETTKEGETAKDTELPTRKITSANFDQARIEIVKSNAGGSLDELYKWHRGHSSSPVSERKPTTGGDGGYGGGGMGTGRYGSGGYGARYGAGGYGPGAGGYSSDGHGAGGIGGGGGLGGAGAGGLGGRFGAGGYGAGGYGAGGTGGVGAGALNASGGGGGGLGGGSLGLGGLGGGGLGADMDFRLPLSRLNPTTPY